MLRPGSGKGGETSQMYKTRKGKEGKGNTKGQFTDAGKNEKVNWPMVTFALENARGEKSEASPRAGFGREEKKRSLEEERAQKRLTMFLALPRKCSRAF